MFDKYNRTINYLRISVTDRCNIRCQYCIPDSGVELLPHDQILSFEEIHNIVKEAVELGINKVRITGGEPLIRRGVLDLVADLVKIKGIEDLSMTTNGMLLGEFAQPLAAAGLKRINVSLDTMNPTKYRTLTRTGDLQLVLSGIMAARKAGLHPIKINCVIANGDSESDAREVKEYCNSNQLEVRFIKKMNLGSGEFYRVEGAIGGHCPLCNRIRLTANGKIKPCLFDDREFDVRQLGVRAALIAAVENKPACGTANHNGRFYNIGG